MKAIHNKRYLAPAISPPLTDQSELMKGMKLYSGLSVDHMLSKTDDSYVEGCDDHIKAIITSPTKGLLIPFSGLLNQIKRAKNGRSIRNE